MQKRKKASIAAAVILLLQTLNSIVEFDEFYFKVTTHICSLFDLP